MDINTLRASLQTLRKAAVENRDFVVAYPWLENAVSDILNKLRYPQNLGDLNEYFIVQAKFNDGGNEREFKEWLEEWFSMKDHPKADAIYSKAYEDGHAYGYHEVLIHYSELVEIVK